MKTVLLLAALVLLGGCEHMYGAGDIGSRDQGRTNATAVSEAR